jgi:hypothetical protein
VNNLKVAKGLFTPVIRATDSSSSAYFKVDGTWTIEVAGSDSTSVYLIGGHYYEADAISWVGTATATIYIFGDVSSAAASKLKVNDAGNSVSYVNVRWSDASVGQVIDADDGTNTNSLNNTNWDFTA